MKKTITLIVLSLFLVTAVCGCGAKPLALQTENVTKIALTTPNGGTLTLEQEEVATVLSALQNASCTTNSTKQDALPLEQFRFTTYNANDTAVNTMVLFSNEYLQVDTALYKGNLSELQTILSDLCKADTLTDLSTVFTIKAEDITEIAFYNNTDKTFKMVTSTSDFESILSPLQALKMSEKGVSGNITQELTLYFRLKNTKEYLPAVELIRYESGTLCKVGGKSAQVSNFSWDVLYGKLAYNKMPIQ